MPSSVTHGIIVIYERGVMTMSCSLHRHDMFSTFDGFGTPKDLAKLAKQLGHTALGTSNHGNTNGLVQTYKACKEEGIKAILGCEGYFLPVYKPQERGYHLCLFAKTLKGYENLNRIQYAGESQKYYNPIWDFSILEEFHEDLICTTACIASYSSQCILKDKPEQAKKYLKKLQQIFGDDLYVEIQPYSVTDAGYQEKINVGMMKLARELDIKCILTADDHRGAKEDFPTYMKMHEMKSHDAAWVTGTYKERYMPELWEMEKRFVKMHGKDVKNAKRFAKEMHQNLEDLEASVEDNILDGLSLRLPKLGGEDEWGHIKRLTLEGLKRRGKCTKEYKQRCMEELKVIRENGFIDYFLIVADYTQWAKDQGIAVGPGRGSVCNCLAAYALYITEVDSLRLGLDFRRFMRIDKKQIPDIDLDFATNGRDRVIDYLIHKYEGHAAQVASYGLYKVENTINDLAKVCGLPTDKSLDSEEIKVNKSIIADLKKKAQEYLDAQDDLMTEEMLADPEVKQYNKRYDNILYHFSKLYRRVRYIGTHAAGVVITSGDVLEYTSLRIDSKTKALYASYNLEDLNDINIIKFDLLGLKTMQSLQECWELTDHDGFSESALEDPDVLERFNLGDTEGIFQLEKKSVQGLLQSVSADCFNDVVAVNAMNRPGPLKAGQPDQYAHNKANIEDSKEAPFYEYTEDSYGTVIYQEQIMLICVYLGNLSWADADKIVKMVKRGHEGALKKLAEEKAIGNDMEAKFFQGAKENGISKADAENMWNGMLVYSFNKGHAAGYSIISFEEMFYKVHYPTVFWYVKTKYAGSDAERERYCAQAVRDNGIVFLPHINYSHIKTSIRKVDGEYVIQQGLSDLKDVGEKAAELIYEERKKNGVFRSYDDFYDRCAGRVVNKKVLRVLEEQGAIEFKKKTYIKRVTMYNSSLFSRASR